METPGTTCIEGSQCYAGGQKLWTPPLLQLWSDWPYGSNADRDELWRMVVGGGQQMGGGVACNEEILVAAPVTGATAAQPPVVPLNPQGFQFGQ
ncbi:hypothetical protein AMATHDRAFT_11495 [Amanita thiersii Skay4041]|uniref:Uncharacterized protein n=1 Tax=Amanita thiersii Skay4041 TaxID=703135 RepID=A0A2A9N8Z6_9AGAR|nr:hypothetical protein AMATHDRAFT_11495 [Amanita thiersii Skay4041]